MEVNGLPRIPSYKFHLNRHYLPNAWFPFLAGKEYVRQKIADYMNSMADLGVKGFRVDASKHMWPGDLAAIQV